MSDIEYTSEFVDELPVGHRSAEPGKYETILEPLMERPGEWCRIMVGGKGVATRIAAMQNNNVRLPGGEWEFARRTLPDGRLHGFARYIGPSKTEAE